LFAVLVGASEMGVACATLGQQFLAAVSERIDHRTAARTAFTADPEILGLEGRALLEETEWARAVRMAAMHEEVPREVVQVAIATRHEKPHRHCHGWRALAPVAVPVDESGPVGTKRARFQLEQTAPDVSHPSTERTPEPSWKGGDGNADSCLGRERVELTVLAGSNRWPRQPSDLRAEDPTDRCQQPILSDWNARGRIPEVEAHDDYGELWQVDQRAAPVSP
jgi:hypothetical protein